MGATITIVNSSERDSAKSHSNLRKWLIDASIEQDLPSLSGDIPVRDSFAMYVKGGTWIEQLESYNNNGDASVNEISHGKRLAIEKKCPVLEYDMSSKVLSQVKPTILQESSSRTRSTSFQSLQSKPSVNFSQTFSLMGSSSPQSPQTPMYLADLYADVEHNPCFTPFQLAAILMATIYPSYLASDDYREFVAISGGQADLDLLDEEEEGDTTPHSEQQADTTVSEDNHPLSILTNTKSRRGVDRVSELLESAAAHFDETVFVDFLQSDKWISQMLSSIDNLPYGLTVCSAEAPHYPVLFTNTTFRTMTGFKDETAICGKDVRELLRGEGTEIKQAAVWDSALQTGTPVKLGVTHYNSQKKAYLSLVALQPVYNEKGVYTSMITLHMDPMHISICNTTLDAVDDLLLLLPRLLIRPVMT